MNNYQHQPKDYATPARRDWLRNKEHIELQARYDHLLYRYRRQEMVLGSLIVTGAFLGVMTISALLNGWFC